MAKYFVICSGGPGLFDPGDKFHDLGWGNYVSSPPFRMDTSGSPPPPTLDPGEKIRSLIYKPAYIERWNDDHKSAPGTGQRDDVDEVLNHQVSPSSSYVEFIEKRHAERGWELDWFKNKTEFWERLREIPGKISRFWYYGHGYPGELWFSLKQPGAQRPQEHEVIKIIDITDNFDLAQKFLDTTSPPATARFPDSAHRFITCNSLTTPPGSKSVALAWRDVFQVHVSGRRGKANFKTILSPSHPNMSGEPDTTDNVNRPLGSYWFPTERKVLQPISTTSQRELLAIYGPPDNAEQLFKQIFGTTPTGTVEEIYQAVDSHFSMRNIDNYTKIGGHVPLIFRSLWGKWPGRILRSTIEIETDYKGIVIHQSKGYDGATPTDLEKYQLINNNFDDIPWH